MELVGAKLAEAALKKGCFPVALTWGAAFLDVLFRCRSSL